jgi:hypothetical protein
MRGFDVFRRKAVWVAAVGAGLAVVLVGAAVGGGSTGSTLRLGSPVTVDIGKVSTPALASDPRSGRVYVAWVRNSKQPGPYGGFLGAGYLARSDNGGKSFSSPLAIGGRGDIQAPQVLAVTPRGTLLDGWASFKKVKQTEFGEYTYWVARSGNGGKSFLVRPLSDGGIQEVSRPNLTVAPDGKVWATWLDGRPYDRTSSDPLYTVNVSWSRSDGLAFVASSVVKGDACQCCRPALAQRPGHPNEVALIWRDVLQKPGTEGHGMEMDGMDPNGKSDPGRVYPKTDIRNVKVAVSTDGGHDFGAGVSIGDFNWKIQACPTIGPAVWWNQSGSRLSAAWFTGALGHVGVYYVSSADGGAHFSKPVELTNDIVGEGYDLATATGRGDSSYVAWGTYDHHVQLARIDGNGSVHLFPKLNGDRVALTSTKTGKVLFAYGHRNKIVVRSVNG